MRSGRLLIVSLLDYTREPNGRIHHLVRHARDAWTQVTVLHADHPVRGGLWTILAALVRFRVQAHQDGNLRRIVVVPLLNTPENLAKRIVRYPGGVPGALGGIRRFAESVLSSLAIGRDLAVILSLFVGLLLRDRGPFHACVVQCPLSGAVGLLVRRAGLARALLYDDIDYAPGGCPHRARRAWIRWLEGYVLRRADRVVSCGTVLAERRQREIGRRVHVIPNGADQELFGRARTRVPHPPTVVYMGRVLEWAGLEVALAALAVGRREIRDLRCMILGRPDPGYLACLQALARRLDLTQTVRFEGEIAYRDLPRYLQACDVGLATFQPHPMKRYAFPLKVVEYMAAGLPVIGTQGSETERIIRSAQCGEVVAYEAGAVARAMVRLFSDPDYYTRLAQNAAEASLRFSWGPLLDQWDRHLREMLQAGEGSRAERPVMEGR